MEYTVSQVTKVAASKYPDSKKYNFLVEGYPAEVSCFSKFPVEVGQKINGYIEQNGQWHNFKFGTAAPAASAPSAAGFGARGLNTLELKIIPMLQHIEAHLDRIEKYVTGEEQIKDPKEFQMPTFPGEEEDKVIPDATDIGF